MKLLLDENLPHELRHELHGHEVATVAYMGWRGIRNGELLRHAAATGFGALVTSDRGMQHQHDLTQLPLAIIVLVTPSNRYDVIKQFVPQLLNYLAQVQPKQFHLFQPS